MQPNNTDRQKEMSLKQKLRSTPALCLVPFILNITFGLCLAAVGVPKFESVFVAAPAAVVLLFMYAALKTGTARLKSLEYDISRNSAGFWRVIAGQFAFYVLVSVLPPVAIFYRQIHHPA